MALLDDALVSHVDGPAQRRRRYSPHSVRDLLRCLRNTVAHFDEAPPHLRMSLAQQHDYFLSRFPALVAFTTSAFLAVFADVHELPSMMRSLLLG